jgi:hypothetical protein
MTLPDEDSAYVRVLLQELAFRPLLDQDFDGPTERVRDLLVRRHAEWLDRLAAIRRKALTLFETAVNHPQRLEIADAQSALSAICTRYLLIASADNPISAKAELLRNSLVEGDLERAAITDKLLLAQQQALHLTVALRRLSAKLHAGFNVAFDANLFEGADTLAELTPDALGELVEAVKVIAPFAKLVRGFVDYLRRQEIRVEGREQDRERITTQNILAKYYEWQATPQGEHAWEPVLTALDDFLKTLEPMIPFLETKTRAPAERSSGAARRSRPGTRRGQFNCLKHDCGCFLRRTQGRRSTVGGLSCQPFTAEYVRNIAVLEANCGHSFGPHTRDHSCPRRI